MTCPRGDIRTPHTVAPTGERWFRSGVKTTVVTGLATAALGWPLEWALKQGGVWDLPNARSSHQSPVPRAGGIAPLLASTIVAVASRPFTISKKEAAAIGTLASLGLIDDLSGNLPVRLRLSTQLAVGYILTDSTLGEKLLGAITTAGIVNVTNFMDGINGISGTTAAVWGLTAIAQSNDTATDPKNPNSYRFIGALTAGGGIGFLPHNALRARLFLGDVGSYSLGGAMAAGVLSRRTLHDKYRAAAPLLLYGTDAAQALIRRRLNGDPIGQPHRGHIYQQLVDAGASHEAVAAFHATLSAIVSLAGNLPRRWQLPVTAAACGVYLCSPHILSVRNSSPFSQHRNGLT